MNRSEVNQQLTTVFQDVFDDNNLKLRDDMSAKDIDEWDSLNHISLVLSVEQKFGIKFKTSEVAQLANVGEFIDLILTKIKK